MKLLRTALAALLLAAGSGPIFGADKPPLPFFDWNACPFECCTYRAWRADAEVKVRAARNTKSPVAFQLEKGEWVRAVTGVVVTHRYGVAELVKPARLGYRVKDSTQTEPLLSLQPGERLYTLHYLGEGHELFWYQDHLYSDQLDVAVQVLSRPVAAWWVKVRRKDGRTGWTNEPRKFGNSDACG